MKFRLYKNENSEAFTALALAFLIILAGGCRQAPDSGTQYYERELEQMQRQAAMASRVEKPVKDGYPWRGNKPEPCLPCRIKTMEKNIKVEIDYLHETVHGRKKGRLRLRD